MLPRGVVVLGIVSAFGVAACTSETVTVVRTGEQDSGVATGGSAPGGSGGRSGAGTGGTSGRAATGGRSGGPACTPTLAQTPAWVPPSPLHQGACTSDEITLVAADCADGTLSTPCVPGAADACRACLISASGDPSYGAVVVFTAPPIIHPNFEGCMAALSGDLSSTGCPAKLLIAGLCVKETCSVCPDPDSYAACVAASVETGGPCKTLNDAKVACEASISPSIRASCFGSSGEERIDIIQRLGDLFCGAGSGDAGADAASADARSDASSIDGG